MMDDIEIKTTYQIINENIDIYKNYENIIFPKFHKKWICYVDIIFLLDRLRRMGHDEITLNIIKKELTGGHQ